MTVPRFGLGTWQWGDPYLWGYGQTFDDADLRASFKLGVEKGDVFFDTAEVYSRGESERLLGKFIRETGVTPYVATKFFPYPWRLVRPGAVRAALVASLQRLGLERVDLYQLHWPIPPLPPSLWMDQLAAVQKEGLVGEIGVSNFSRWQMERAQKALASHGVKLASNQVELNLLHTPAIRSGLLDACKAEGIKLIAYSPLAMGLLGGKYDSKNQPSGMRGGLSARRARNLDKVLGVVRAVAAETEKTPAQVSIAWVLAKGAAPIPGARNEQQVAASLAALDWSLSTDQVLRLDAATR